MKTQTNQTRPVPTHLMLTQNWNDRLGKGPNDNFWLEPHDIISIVADDPEHWTAQEVQLALSLSRDSLLFAGLKLQQSC